MERQDFSNTDSRKFGNQKKQRIVSFAISLIITLWGLFESLNTEKACFVFLVGAVMLLLTSWALNKEYKEQAETLRINAVIVIVVTLLVYFLVIGNRASGSVWYYSLRENPYKDREETLSKADAGDGVKQVEAADFYEEEEDYIHAMKYAQKSADNGNDRATIRLANYYVHGLGGKPDIHQGISNLINVMRREKYDHLDLLREVGIAEESLSKTDSMRFAWHTDNQRRISEIIDQADSIYNKKGWIDAKAYIDKNKSVLKAASLGEYRPATRLLYASEAMKNPNGSKELHRLSQMLYQSCYLPTNTFDRGFFYQYYYLDTLYNTDNYQRYINDNDYSLLVLGYQILNQLPPEKIHMLGNEGLLNEYELFRAQYRWFKHCLDTSFVPVVLVWGNSLVNIMNEVNITNEDELVISRELLQRSIREIQDRMDDPAAIINNGDFIESHKLEIKINTPWSRTR